MGKKEMLGKTNTFTDIEGYLPFYERAIRILPFPYHISSFLIMIPNFLLHFVLGKLFGVKTLSDFSWFLPIMSAGILILLLWATNHLRQFTINLYPAFKIDKQNNIPRTIVENHVKDVTMLKYGFSFGFANLGLGLFYGFWYEQPVLLISLGYQIFLAGFIAGMAISGIISILKVVNYITDQKKTDMDFDCPDRCGGMTRIGNSLLKFSLVSLIAGIMIAYYIYNSPWSHQNWKAVIYFMYAWMGFPHFAALSVLLIPFLKIHEFMRNTKSQYLTVLKSKINSIRLAFINDEGSMMTTNLEQIEILRSRPRNFEVYIL